MLTPQEVSTHAFTKSVLNGYNMAMVDEFLDELTIDYTALYRENEALKAKMKSMSEKVDEYRSTEDSMRSTLLTAQRTADAIIQEAEARRDEILAAANDEALAQVEECRREVMELEDRMRRGRQELARFISAGRELCSRELKFLEHLPQMEVEPPLAPRSQTVKALESAPVPPVDPVAAMPVRTAAPIIHVEHTEPEAPAPVEANPEAGFAPEDAVPFAGETERVPEA